MAAGPVNIYGPSMVYKAIDNGFLVIGNRGVPNQLFECGFYATEKEAKSKAEMIVKSGNFNSAYVLPILFGAFNEEQGR